MRQNGELSQSHASAQSSHLNWMHWSIDVRNAGRAARRNWNPRIEFMEARALLASITEYPIPGGTTSLGNGLFGITGGPDGNVYFTDTEDNAIGQIDPSGNIHEFPNAPGGGGGFFKNGLDGIALGSDDELVFTESTQGALGKITTTGSYSQYPIGSSGSLTGQGPDQITTASDGTLWWTEDGSNAIGELTRAGVFNQYAVPNAYSGGIIGPSMKGITVGSDGNIWFTNWGPFGDFIGKMTPAGSVTEFPLSGGTDPYGITSGPDGNLWFVAYGTNTIDVMSTAGTMLDEDPIGNGLGSLADITVGSDNNLYFTAQTGYIGEITTSGVVTSTPVSTTVQTVPGASGPQPLAITSGPDGNIWFTDPWTDSIGVLRIAPSRLPTMTALSTSTATAAPGQSVTLTATVSDLSPGGASPNGGTVTFSDQNGVLDRETLVDGVATYTTSTLAVGTDTVTAFYAGSASFAPSATGRIVTAVGSGAATYAGDLNEPCGLAGDSEGDLFIADAADNVVQEVVKATGDVIAVAGNGMAGYKGDGLLATNAELDFPEGVAVDSAGDVFIADTVNNMVREVVEATGDIFTVAGNGMAGYQGDGQLATDAELDNPYAVAVDRAGDLFIADWGNSVIREVVKETGDIITFAGTGVAGDSGNGGLATDAMLDHPEGIALDSAGDLLIADWKNNMVREVVKATGNIIAVAGNGTAGEQGDGGLATAAKLDQPVGLAFDSVGDLLIAEYGGDVVREVENATGDIVTVAGDGKTGYTGDGGLATAAELDFPFGLAVDSAGDVFMSDVTNSVVREFTQAVTVSVSAPNMLVIHTRPSAKATAGKPFAIQPVVYVEDSSGNLDTSDNSSVITVSLASGMGPLQGKSLSVTAVGGIASFSGLFDNTAETITLQFSAAGMISSQKASIDVLPATPFRLKIETQPSPTATAGVPFATQPVIEELDLYGNVETTDSSTPITASVDFGNGPLDGSATVTLSAGVATFTSVSGTSIGTIALLFSGGGFKVGPSDQIVISPGPATQLAIKQQPGATVTAGNAFSGPIAIDVEDKYGNLVSSDNSTVVTASLNSGNGSLKGASPVTVQGGVATLTNLEVDTAGPLTLEFASGTLIPAISRLITVSPAKATRLALTTLPPSPVIAGQPFIVVVAAEDPFDNVATSFDGNVTLSVAGDPSFTTMVAAKNGVASFVGLSLGAGSQGVSIEATAGGLSPVASSPITVNPRPTITGEQVVTYRKTNTKGRPVGKSVFGGFQLTYSTPMNSAAGSKADYQVLAPITTRINKKKSYKPVDFTTSYNAVTNTVTLNLKSKTTFAKGGEITVVYSPPNGVSSAAGVGLDPNYAKFTIQPGAKGITLA